MSVHPEPHDELGVSADASMDEIHRAFRRLLREHHPDTRQQSTGHDDESDRVLQRAMTAYAELRDRHAARDRSVGTGRGQQEVHRAPGATSPAGRSSPSLRVTPVEWLPATSARRGTPRQTDVHPEPNVESLLRWLLDGWPEPPRRP